jgi:3'-5' exonuclease
VAETPVGRGGGAAPGPRGVTVASYLVLDIETVVDLAVWTPPANEPDAFPPPYAHRPICIACVLLAEDREERRTIKTVKVGVFEAEPEVSAEARELYVLARFAGYMNEQKPTVVTWNGRRFDLPVLMMRSMRAGLAAPWYYHGRDVRYRYTEVGHCDLADAMSDYGASDRPRLDGAAKLIGLPGKFGDIDGAGVAGAFAAGRIREIGSYCMADAVQTALLWLRWLRLKGELAPDAYQRSAEHLLQACSATGRLDELVRLADRRVLLLEERAEAAA